MTTNNKDKKQESNTKGFSLYGRDNENRDRALGVRYFGNKMVVGIHYLLPENQQTDKAKYDYKGGTFAYLIPDEALALSEVIRAAILAKQAGGKIKSKGITSGNSGNLEIASGDKYGLDGNSLCIVIRNVDPATKKSLSKDIFEFKGRVNIVNYDDAGTYETETMETNLLMLQHALEEFADGMTNGRNHSFRVDNSYSMGVYLTNQRQMLAALGVTNDTASTRTDWSAAPANSGSVGQSKSSDDLAEQLSTLYS